MKEKQRAKELERGNLLPSAKIPWTESFRLAFVLTSVCFGHHGLLCGKQQRGVSRFHHFIKVCQGVGNFGGALLVYPCPQGP